jgi:hypothetical protein
MSTDFGPIFWVAKSIFGPNVYKQPTVLIVFLDAPEVFAIIRGGVPGPVFKLFFEL